MSRSITIRNVPDDVVDELAARAERSGRSMQEYVKSKLVNDVSRPDINEWVDRVQERKRRTGGASISDEWIVETLHDMRE